MRSLLLFPLLFSLMGACLDQSPGTEPTFAVSDEPLRRPIGSWTYDGQFEGLAIFAQELDTSGFDRLQFDYRMTVQARESSISMVTGVHLATASGGPNAISFQPFGQTGYPSTDLESSQDSEVIEGKRYFLLAAAFVDGSGVLSVDVTFGQGAVGVWSPSLNLANNPPSHIEARPDETAEVDLGTMGAFLLAFDRRYEEASGHLSIDRWAGPAEDYPLSPEAWFDSLAAFGTSNKDVVIRLTANEEPLSATAFRWDDEVHSWFQSRYGLALQWDVQTVH